jgi:hypothetical protein
VPNKFSHVKRDTVPAKDCLWPGCKTLIPKSHTMCEPHWLLVPKPLRDAVWSAYEANQENAPDEISEAYAAAVEEARIWAVAYLAVST